ncbi:MAG: aspartate aminotransferase family protein [Deltaproteobacteria bacterium]|nr:aspartate aminotransferase family protein [Deltaproteobacteria bacterium]
MGTNEETIGALRGHLLPNYQPAPVVLTRGRGCRVEDVEGRSYLDMCAGIAVVSLGHSHPKLVAAIAEQAGRLMHTSNLYWNDKQLALGEELTRRTFGTRAFFCNSGAEANEALLKLARKWHHLHGRVERREIVCMDGSFHGRTMGAVSMTGQPKYHVGMEPLVPGIRHVPFGDLDALRAVVGPATAAVLVEPVQGEGGVTVPPPGYLAGIRALCDERGALLFLDEVQTGIGRTGTFLAHEQLDVTPDAVSLAKGIAGGFPMGAMVCSEKLADGLPFGSHATTFGGNPLACAAALATLRILDDEKILENVRTVGAHLGARLEELASKHADLCEGARGLGLLRGVSLRAHVDARAMLMAAQGQGVLLSIAGGRVLRFSPPLVVTREEIDEGVALLDRTLSAPPAHAIKDAAE